MEKELVDVRYFLDTASVDELTEFHAGLVEKNHDSVFDELLKCLLSMIQEKRGVLH